MSQFVQLFKQFLPRNLIARHLILIMLTFLLLAYIMVLCLKAYTQHGAIISTPNLIGSNLETAQKVTKQNLLRIAVVDSFYKRGTMPGLIMDQQPPQGFGIKKHRLIQVTVSAHKPPMLTVPTLTDIALRQAQNLITSSGFEVGSITYTPSDFDGLTLQVTYRNQAINAGDKLPAGSALNLVVGKKE